MNGIAIIVGLVIAAVGAFVILRMLGKRGGDGDADRHARMAEKPASKPSKEAPRPASREIKPSITATYAEQPAHDLNEGLSQSGALTIGAEVKRCIDAEKWDEAIKWLLHASDALPDRIDFKVTLAEIYAKGDDRENFTALFEKLYVDIDDSSEDFARLVKIARDFIPEHTVFRT